MYMKATTRVGQGLIILETNIVRPGNFRREGIVTVCLFPTKYKPTIVTTTSL
jgi:hypothetical protein